MEIFTFLCKVILISLSGVMAPGAVTAATIAHGSKNPNAGFAISIGHGIIDADDYGDIGPEWGTFRLENDEGAWEGPMSGFNMGTDTHMAAWLQGEGAYTGLTYYYEIVVSNSGLELNGPVQGFIYPGAPPATE